MRGQDLIHAVEISALQAMLGATVKIPSHEGEREIELPPGTQHGDPVRAARPRPARARAAVPPATSHRRPRRSSPRDLTEEQRELAEKLEETLEARNLALRSSGDDGFFSRVRRAFG